MMADGKTFFFKEFIFKEKSTKQGNLNLPVKNQIIRKSKKNQLYAIMISLL